MCLMDDLSITVLAIWKHTSKLIVKIDFNASKQMSNKEK